MTTRAPLTGVRVVDLSQLLPGPYASRVLLDMGAAVDKLEPPQGDPARAMLPPMFDALNAGKRSVVLDLKSAEPGRGREAFLRLLPRYDVLIEQFRPGVMARLGLPYEAMHAANPHLIICAISGYGQTGPLASRAGHDLNYLARTGLLAAQGPAGQVPATPGFQVADIGGAQEAALQIVAALFARDRSPDRPGTVLDVSLAESAAPFAIAEQVLGTTFDRGDAPLAGGLAVYNCYETKDAKYVALAALEPRFWRAFSRGAGWAEDDAPCFLGAHQAAWKARLADLFKTRTRDEWAEFGATHDCCLEPVLPFADVEMSKPAIDRGAVPKLGEHTEEVLAEV